MTAAQSVFAVAIIASLAISRKEAWVMLGLFAAQLAESYMAEVGWISPQASTNARIGVGVVFLVAAGWVLRSDLRLFASVLRTGFRAPWAALESQEEPV